MWNEEYIYVKFKAFTFTWTLLRREIPMAWGTTTNRLTPKINPFLYARETKHLTLNDIYAYFILDG